MTGHVRGPRLNVAAVGSVPLLDEEAADQLIAATMPLEPVASDRGALREVLLHVFEAAFHASFGTRAKARDVRALRKAYDHLQQKIKAQRSLSYPPPAPPGDWQFSFEQWLGEEENIARSRSKGGRPSDAWDHLVYIELLPVSTGHWH